jgi:MFS family permease
VLYGFTAIFEPISTEQSWSYTEVSIAASIRSVEAGLLAPLSGWLVDRLGPRKMLFAGGLFMASGLFVISFCSSLAMFYGGFVLIALGSDCTGSTVLITAVTHWFKKRLGLAGGLTVAGFGFGGLLVPLVTWLIDANGWRSAIFILAIVVLVIMVPLSLLFRHKPEQYGLVPDGTSAPVTEISRSPKPAETRPEASFTFKQALRTPTFWILAVVFMFHNIALQAVVTHSMPYSNSIGIQRATASVIAMMIPLTSILARVLFGWLGDRTSKRWLIVVGFVLMCFGLLSLAFMSSVGFWLVVPFLLFFGFGYGGNIGVRPSFAREIFGRRNFGAIFGTIIGICSVGGMLGPILGGIAFDNWNSYVGLWLILAILPVMAVISIIFARPGRVKAQ